MRHHRHRNTLYLAGSIALVSLAAWGQTSLVVNRTLTVAATGTPEDNCTAFIEVLNGITDSSASNSYHVRLEPGVYDCGNLGITNSITVPPFVIVAGAGTDATRIQGTLNNLDTGLISLSHGSELRFLTTINEGADGSSFAHAVGVLNLGTGDVSARVSHVRAVTEACTHQNCGAALAVTNSLELGSALLVLHHSYAEGPKKVVECVGAGAAPKGKFVIEESQLVSADGSSVVSRFCAVSDVTCVNAFDDNFDPLGKDCLPPT